MNKSSHLFLFFAALFFMSSVGCIRQNYDVIISGEKCILTKIPRVFKTPKIISRNRESATVLLYLPNGFIYRDGIFKLNDGRVFDIKVALIDNAGIRYETKYYGRVGEAYAADFGHIKESVKIISVEVSSTIEIQCEKIVWQCYDPI